MALPQNPSDPGSIAVSMLALLCVFALCVPLGFLLSLVVKRMMPLVGITSAALTAGYIVGFVVLYVLLGQLIPSLAWYNAASISMVVSAGIVFFIAYSVRRALFARSAELRDEQAFKVQDEDVRNRPKNLRRR